MEEEMQKEEDMAIELQGGRREGREGWKDSTGEQVELLKLRCRACGR